MLEDDVCAAEIINLRPATGKIGHPFGDVHKFSANLRFYVGTLEFTFDLLHRAVQWSIFFFFFFSVTYVQYFCNDDIMHGWNLLDVGHR